MGAYAKYPGLTFTVQVDATRVSVHLSAPLDLPLAIPDSPEDPRVGATGSAVVEPE